MGDQKEIRPTYSILKFKGQTLHASNYWNFVLSKWMRSFRYGNDYVRLSDSDSYYDHYGIFLTKLLYHPEAVIRIAVLTEDEDVGLGFSVTRGLVLDYVHVHKDCRKQGIAKSLVPKGIERITHLTNIGMRLWAEKMPNAKFDPFI